MMRKRFAVFGVLVLVLALLMPSRAFGWDLIGDGVWWRGSTSEGMYGACVHADNKYDAAAWLFSPGDPAMLSSEVRTKLSDPNYGGRFYEYAQTFSFMEDLTQYPEWLPAYVGVANLFVNGFGVGIFDVGFYTSNVSESLYAGAKIDFQRVLAGEDLSGGGDVSEPDLSDGVTYEFSFGSANFYYSSRVSASNRDTFANSSGTTRLHVPPDKLSYVTGFDYVVCGVVSFTGPSYNATNAKFCSFAYGTNNPNVSISSGTNSQASVHVDSGHYVSSSFVPNDMVTLSGFSSSSYVFNLNTSTGGTSRTFWVGWVKVVPSSDFFGSPAAPSPPSGTWPEPVTPVTPDPPEVPTPTAPVGMVEPSVSGPSVVWPDITINVEPTPEGLDYTELLTAINNNLNSLRSDLLQEFESVEQSLRNIYQFLQHLDTMLERHCQHLRDALSDCTHHLELYMKELFEWLPQQLNYDAEFSYDDSAVTSLLRAILNKIPGGSSGIPDTFKPNPQADEPGFFDWLTDLWHRFLIDLVSVLPDEIGGLVDAFSQLTHYFPFSIPWDLAAMLALFEHEPVTPVFDVPWGFGGNEGDVEMIRVDLSPWDGVMQMVRPVFVVGFCWQLALITKDLLAGFDLNKGGV